MENVKSEVSLPICNGLSSASQESIYGLVLLHPHLKLLQIGKTVVRKDYVEMGTFRLLSGGPSGYEPMFSGYVGKGMLTASIQGDLFKAPSTSEILHVIRELSFASEWGVFVIIQQSSTCTLNFALAIEKARAEGLLIKSLIISDDCSLISPNEHRERQGLTGAIIIIKVASAMAELGKSLCETVAYCESLHKNVATVMIVFKHGEKTPFWGGSLHCPMTSRRKLKSNQATDIAEDLMTQLGKRIDFRANSNLVLMINNIRCSHLEENILTSECIKALHQLNVSIERIYIGSFMSLIDLKGFTLTLIPSNETLLKYLDHPTEAPSWKMRLHGIEAAPVHLPPRIKLQSFPRIPAIGPNLTPRESNILLVVLQFACDAIISCRKQLDIMDSEQGRGDLGERLEIAAATIRSGLNGNAINLSNMHVMFKMLANVADTISGTLGAVYSIMFVSCAATFAAPDNQDAKIDEVLWITCLRNVVNTLKSYSYEGSVMHGLQTPLSACLDTLTERYVGDVPILEAFEYAVHSAEKAAYKMTSKAQRFAHGESSRYPNAEAHAVGIWLRAVFQAVKFRCQF